MLQKRHRLLLAVAFVAGAALVSFLAFCIVRTPPPPPLPNPNGYDDFLKAAALVSGDTLNDASTLGHDELRALVSANAESLRLTRLGLTRQSSFPTASGITNTAAISRLSLMGRPARLLTAEGRLAEMENRNGDAARSYVEAIRVGNEISRGGFIVNRGVGIGCEARGCQALALVMPKLSREDGRTILAELQKVDANHVRWDEILQNERQYLRYQHAKHYNPIWLVQDWWLWRIAKANVETKHKLITAHERLLEAELAVRSYQSEQGRLPARLGDLVTNYLSHVPPDPFRGRPLIYHAQGTNWLLYSVGPDGIDDGGRPAGRGLSGKGDILFDSPW